MSNTKMSRAENLLGTCQDRMHKAAELLDGLHVQPEVAAQMNAALIAVRAVMQTLRSHQPPKYPDYDLDLDDVEGA